MYVLAKEEVVKPIQALSPQINLPDVEISILDFWKRQEIFKKSIDNRSEGDSWTFYEGPPTANGAPGTHHIEARVFKDTFPRFHTMKGKKVVRKAGWDCHGLPIEAKVYSNIRENGGDPSKEPLESVQQMCRKYAGEQIAKQKKQFQTLVQLRSYFDLYVFDCSYLFPFRLCVIAYKHCNTT